MDIAAIDTVNPNDYLSPAELEEYYAVEAERFDPDNPYGDLTEDDTWSLECPHASIVETLLGRDCEDCNTVWR